MNSAVVHSVQVTGITVQLEKPLDHSLLIELSVYGNDSRSVRLKQKEMPVGNHPLHPPLQLRQGSFLSIRVQEKYQGKGDQTLAQLLIPLETIWLVSDQSTVVNDRTKNFPIHFMGSDKRLIWLNVVELTSMPLSDASGLGQDITLPENISRTLEEARESLRGFSQDVVQKLGDFKTALERLGGEKYIVESMEFGGINCELCPSSKAVVGSVNALYETIKTQGDGHRELLGLAMSIERTVNLIQPVKDITELNELKKPLELFPELMTKTIDLIETWAKQSALANVVLTRPTNDKIDDLNKRYTEFDNDFRRGYQIDAANKNPSLKSQNLKELKDILLDGVKMVKPKAIPCIPGTRTVLLEEVEAKIDDRDSTNILWIRGAPGSGKSALSLSSKYRIQRQGRLLTYYRFDRNESATTTAIALWCYIAYNLACQFPIVGKRVLQQLQDRNFKFDSPTTVFTSLVETPLSELIDLPITRSLVLVIDALDECGGSDGRLSLERKELLQTLRRWPRLHKRLKLLVTSREENDISRALSTISTSIHIPSGTFLIDNPREPASIAASEDIRIFLEHRFSEIRAQLNDDGAWPGTQMLGGMVHRAAGNFMWATAAVNFIDEGVNPEDRLDSIMSDVPLSSGMEPLYSLYCTILETAFGKVVDSDSEAVTLRAVLGIMICAKRTLSDDEYTKLPIQGTISRRTLASIRNCLGSVIVTDGNLRFAHKSFDDFLRSPLCPLKYAVNVDTSHHLLTNLCLTSMGNGLHFNLCDLETSCLKNTDIPDIEMKVANGIPPLLSYSCRFWTDHLSLVPSDQHLMSEVKAMVMDKLLYWFEAMSLLKEINRVSPSLLLVLKWFHSSPDDEFKEFLSDARQFIAAFGGPIAQSAPHIYISALPFAPENSLVAQHYLPRFPWTLSLTVGKPTNWPSCIFTLRHHGPQDHIVSVTLSPDERYIVWGSLSGSIFISDFETGNLISGPFMTGWELRSVFFDPDGQHVWAVCKAGRLVGFDIETREKHNCFEVGHTIGCCRSNEVQNIISVKKATVVLWSPVTGTRPHNLSMTINSMVYLTTLSPNGRRIAGVKADDRKTVRMWKLVEASEIQLVQGPSDRQPHPSDISALSFSVDSNFAVSGSHDGTILIWDAGTGNVVGSPLSTGNHGVNAITYSHEHRRLISLHDNGTVMVWNTITCQAVVGPLNNLRGIASITLSQDGRKALLGTKRGALMKWDLDKKVNVLAIQPGDHCAGYVPCSAFSPDDRKLATLHSKQEIRFWDTSTYDPLPGSITLPSIYSKLVFSSDGSQIATYHPVIWKADVRVWSTDTRELTFHQDIDDHIWFDHVAFRAADQKLVACSEYGDVRIWNLQDSAHPPVVAKLPMILALSPDGSTVIVRDNNRTPRHYMWSTITYQPLPLTFTDDDNVEGSSNAYYSSTGSLLAVTSYKINFNLYGQTQNTLRVWNTQTGDLTAGPLTIHDQIHCLTFSHDNSYIAFSLCSCDRNTIWIWDARTGGLISSFWTIHTSNITALNFSTKGESLMSGSADGQIRVWNTADLLGNSPVSVGFMPGGMDIRDGWVVTAGQNLGFWVPPDHREKLAWNGIIAVIGGERRGIITHLDLTRFKYGENWTECFGEAK